MLLVSDISTGKGNKMYYLNLRNDKMKYARSENNILNALQFPHLSVVITLYELKKNMAHKNCIKH